MKKISFILIGILVLVGIIAIFILNPFEKSNNAEISEDIVSGADLDLFNKTEEAEEKEIVDDEKVTYTVLLEHIEPMQVGDEYGWMLTSEPGQLAYSLNALGLDYSNSELFAEETVVLYPQSGIDLVAICNKLNLDIDSVLTDSMPIKITYSQDDIVTSVPTEQ